MLHATVVGPFQLTTCCLPTDRRLRRISNKESFERSDNQQRTSHHRRLSNVQQGKRKAIHRERHQHRRGSRMLEVDDALFIKKIYNTVVHYRMIRFKFCH